MLGTNGKSLVNKLNFSQFSRQMLVLIQSGAAVEVDNSTPKRLPK